MMTVYIDGIVVQGRPRDLVALYAAPAMRHKPQSLSAYKRDVQRRAAIVFKERIRVWPNKTFLRDLARLGEIQILQEA